MKKLIEKYFNPKLDRTDKEDNQIKQAEKWAEVHGTPKTRREFLHSGLIASASYMTLPTIVNVLANAGVAEAQECASASLNEPAFIGVNGSGGATLASFLIPQGRNDYLTSYGDIGVGSTANIPFVQLFGPDGPAGPAFSGFITQLQATATATALANTAAVVLACRSRDDSSENAYDWTPYIAPMKSTILPPIGEAPRAISVLPPKPILPVNGPAAVEGAVSLGDGPLGGTLSSNSKESLFSAIEQLSNRQIASTLGNSGSNVLADLVSNATSTNTSLVNSAGAFNPAADPVVQNLAFVTNELADATVAFNALNGNSSLGMHRIGGCDYHNNGLANQIGKDGEFGIRLGNILNMAELMGRPVCITFTSDGACGHPNSEVGPTEPTSDSGGNGCALMFFYDPNGRPDYVNGNQVGWFEGANGRVGASEDAAAITTNPERLIVAIAANYAAFLGKHDIVSSIAPGVLSREQLTSVVKIARRAAA